MRDVRKPRCDVLMATNFSWWGLKTRAELARLLPQLPRQPARRGHADAGLLRRPRGPAGPDRGAGAGRASTTSGTRTSSTPSPAAPAATSTSASPTAAGWRRPSATTGACGRCPRPATCWRSAASARWSSTGRAPTKDGEPNGVFRAQPHGRPGAGLGGLHPGLPLSRGGSGGPRFSLAIVRRGSLQSGAARRGGRVPRRDHPSAIPRRRPAAAPVSRGVQSR